MVPSQTRSLYSSPSPTIKNTISSGPPSLSPVPALVEHLHLRVCHNQNSKRIPHTSAPSHPLSPLYVSHNLFPQIQSNHLIPLTRSELNIQDKHATTCTSLVLLYFVMICVAALTLLRALTTRIRIIREPMGSFKSVEQGFFVLPMLGVDSCRMRSDF